MSFYRLILSRACLVAALCLSIVPAGAAPPALNLASDLAQDAAQSLSLRQPVVLFFTQPGCSYCRIVRYDHFLPMLRERGERDPVLLREISVTGERSVKGLDGRAITEAELAARYRVQMTPTVLFIGPEGDVLAEPIIGGNHPEYLRVFLQRHAEAAAKIGAKRVRILR